MSHDLHSYRKKKPVGGVALFGGADLFGSLKSPTDVFGESPTKPSPLEPSLKTPPPQTQPKPAKTKTPAPGGGVGGGGGGGGGGGLFSDGAEEEDDIFAFSGSAIRKARYIHVPPPSPLSPSFPLSFSVKS